LTSIAPPAGGRDWAARQIGLWSGASGKERAMAGFDDEIFGAPPAKPPVHAIGQPIDDLSAPELAERITVLKLEIERLERAIVQRDATRNAAAAFFKS
jgi:uncharacterized small protein (DUF1192 family)